MSMTEVRAIAEKARRASFAMQSATTEQKNAALRAVAEQLLTQKEAILNANKQDKVRAVEEKREASLRARLDLEGSKFESLIKGVQVLEKTPDLVGRVSLARELTPGLDLFRVSCPIGVICVVFEARPEAAVQISTLAIKSGNCVILKGGKEAVQSNQVLVSVLQDSLIQVGLPKDAVQLVSTREEVGELLKLNGLIDLVIPRGSNQLVKSVMDATSIPVLGHADGICFAYLDEDTPEVDLVTKVIVDSKTNYPAACNALETLLVHRSQLGSVLKSVGEALAKSNVSMISDELCLSFLPPSHAKLARSDFGFDVEHLALVLSIKAVDSMDEAIDFINTHGSHHTDIILTNNEITAAAFCRRVDSAGVYHNCSSRFADGFRYGFGAEVGVSTNRVHARGPVGMEGLLTYKYVARGSGQVVGGTTTADYTHRDLEGAATTMEDIFSNNSGITTTKRAKLEDGDHV